MIPVMQTRFGYPHGNCWEACLASLLGVPIEKIPDGRPDGERATYRELSDFLMERRQAIVGLSFLGTGQVAAPPRHYYMLSGTTESGLGHAVIALDGVIVHNPNPDPEARLVSISGAEWLVAASPDNVPYLEIAEMPTDEEMEAVMAARAGAE